MTNTKHLLLAIALVFNTIAFAQLKTPAPSPNATIEQMVGLTQVKIEYSRPGKKDRDSLETCRGCLFCLMPIGIMVAPVSNAR